MSAGQRFYVNARAIIERLHEGRTQVLLQRRQKPPERWEFPGGQFDPFEGILAALAREVQEETGLSVTRVLDDPGRHVTDSDEASVECLKPAFVYQTTRGPVDSVGFYFRVEAQGTLTTHGDEAGGHTWVDRRALPARLAGTPEDFDWLTRAALGAYLREHERSLGEA
ncbi:NUDIX domain-containing protein [Deinococcus aquiradiocola]|uniref:Nudix hydrolase domain-containing protein n=1 Tax=Deinococcus aquiradiocola TaxID=393059 RepID=A0A917UQS3_9DEIO|nr:NUDIX hydrolase [Deinococcus aquiradiocola]GGJ77114.1 hypothetical protein GCM10008939_21510 [Deinococcus aquiradiocola]